MSAAQRAERGFYRALNLTGVTIRLRRSVAAQGAYDPATGNVASAAPTEILVPAIMANETIRLEGGAVATRRVAALPARLIERYLGASQWGAWPWSGELPVVPQSGDEIVEGAAPAQRVISADPTRVNGQTILYRLSLAGGAA